MAFTARGSFSLRKRNNLIEIQVAVITVSDRSYRNERPDLSGPALCDFVSSMGWKVIYSTIVNDELSMIESILRKCVTHENVDLILTTGGTGLSPRDNTPEATMKVVEKTVPGLTEYMRMGSVSQNPNSVLSRAVAGITQGKLIINLPGSPTGAVETLKTIAGVIPHAIGILKDEKLHDS